MTPYPHRSIEDLRRFVREGEGALLVAPEGSPLYAGMHRGAAGSLMEAALTFLDDPIYEEIIIASSVGSHLPEFRITQTDMLSVEAYLWVYRSSISAEDSVIPASTGAGATPRANPAPAPDPLDPAPHSGSVFPNLDGLLRREEPGPDVASGRRILYRETNSFWVDRMERLMSIIAEKQGRRWRDGEHRPEGQPDGRRRLVLIDGQYLQPTQGQTISLSRDLFWVWTRRFRDLLGGAQGCHLDLVILVESSEKAKDLQEGRYFTSLETNYQNQQIHIVRNDVPQLSCPGVPVLILPAVAPEQPWGRFLRKADPSLSLLQNVQTALPSGGEAGRGTGAVRGFPLKDYVTSERVYDYIEYVRKMVQEPEQFRERSRRDLMTRYSEEEATEREEIAYELAFKRCSAMVYGPPGTGKTTLAQVLVSVLGGEVPVEKVETTHLSTGGLQDLNLDRLQTLYDGWKKHRLCIVYFNEAESYLSKDNPNMSGLVNAIKSKLEPPGGRIDTNIIYIADTNDPEVIDPAIRSRLQTGLYIGLPSLHGRMAALENLLHESGPRVLLAPAFTLERFAECLEGRSLRDITLGLFGAINEKIQWCDASFTVDMAFVQQWLDSRPIDERTITAVRKFGAEQEAYARECELRHSARQRAAEQKES